MVNWYKLQIKDFEFDEHIEEKLHAHGVNFGEAVECSITNTQSEETRSS